MVLNCLLRGKGGDMPSMKRYSMSLRRVWFLIMVLVIAIVSASSLADAGVGNDWRLLVKSAACVQGPDVMLGEIADPVSSMDQRTWKTIASIKLWKAAVRPGRPVTVSQEKLRKIQFTLFFLYL